jgi:hypothetical protein
LIHSGPILHDIRKLLHRPRNNTVLGHKNFLSVSMGLVSIAGFAQALIGLGYRSLTLFLRLLTFCSDPAQSLLVTFFHPFL